MQVTAVESIPEIASALNLNIIILVCSCSLLYISFPHSAPFVFGLLVNFGGAARCARCAAGFLLMRDSAQPPHSGRLPFKRLFEEVNFLWLFIQVSPGDSGTIL